MHSRRRRSRKGRNIRGDEKQTEFENFEEMTGRLLNISHASLKEKLDAEKAAKKRKKRKKKGVEHDHRNKDHN